MTHVTGPVVLPDGTPAKSRAVLFRRTEDALFALPEGTVVPEIVSARTDAAGAIDVDLLPGAYVVTVPIWQGSVSADIVVPDAETAGFATLVTNGAIPDAKPAWFDAAIADATVSVEFPPGVPGQVLGYGPDGSVLAVAGGSYDDAPLTARVEALEEEPPPSWGEVTGKPAEFPPAAHRHDASEIENLPAGGSTAWADLTGVPSTFPAAPHTHAWSEVTGKPTTFAPEAHTHEWADISDPPATYAPSAHSHAIADVTGLQAALDAATGGAGLITSVNGKTGDVVLAAADVGAAPASHGHAWGDVTGKPSTFPAEVHGHAIADVTGLQTALDGKAAAAHSHPWADVTGKPTAFPPETHGHTIGDVTGLQTALDGKAAASHSHAWADITAKPAVIAAGADQAAARAAIGAGTSNLVIGTTASTAKAGNYAPTWAQVTGKPTTFTPAAHTHAIADVTGLQGALDGKLPTTTFKTINGEAITGTGDIVTPTGLAAVTLTQAAYDALATKDPNTLYIISG